MLNPSELEAWYSRLNLGEQAQKVIDHVRSSDPARRVGGGRSNVSGLYPSRKMGVTIQFESHCVELAAIYAMEHDPLTLEFYDQPPSIILDYSSAKGKRLFRCIRTEMKMGSPEEYNAETGLAGPTQKLQTGEPKNETTSLYRIRRSQENHLLLREAARRHHCRRRKNSPRGARCCSSGRANVPTPGTGRWKRRYSAVGFTKR